jgi:hypothetical protein
MRLKLDAVNLLLSPKAEVPVWPGRLHVLTLAEQEMIRTEPMQRLRRLRQIGLAYHALPLSEHTRFSHRIGTSYWASRMLDSLAPADRAMVEAMEDRLGPHLSLPLLVRLIAIVHDIALLPLGHTLRFQLCLFDGHAFFDEAMSNCLLRVVDGCSENLMSHGTDRDERQAIKQALQAHFKLVAAVARVPRLLAGAVPHPLTGPLCAPMSYRTYQCSLSSTIWCMAYIPPI